ncbi:MAG: energy transducer TonB [Nitrospirota bacterium]
MREPSLQKTTLLSVIVHVSVLLIALLMLRQSAHISVPSPYTVNLVSPDVFNSTKKEDMFSLSSISAKAPLSSDAIRPDTVKPDTTKKFSDKAIIEDKIAAIIAKKKIEKIVKLRSLISLKANEGRSEGAKRQNLDTKGTLFDDYFALITREIRQQWIYPDTGQKDIEAILSVRISKDGTAVVQKIEKSSGNALFDRSAIRALAKASPLTPPPHEMEIGVRFYP